MKDNHILQMLLYFQTGKEVYAENFTQSYRPYLHKLTITDDLLTFDHHGVLCIVVPESLRQEILTLNHIDWSAGHFGTFKTHRKVLQSFWWPSLLNDIKAFIVVKFVFKLKDRTGEKRKWDYVLSQQLL